MTPDLASQILIVLCCLCLAFNLYQLSFSYKKMLEEIQVLIDAVKNGEASVKSLQWMHLFFYGLFPFGLLYLMFEAKFVLWVTLAVGLKFCISGIWSYRMQVNLLNEKTFSKHDFRLHQLDYFLNLVLILLLLAGIFGV